MQSFKQYLKEDNKMLNNREDIQKYLVDMFGERAKDPSNFEIMTDLTVMPFETLVLDHKRMSETGYPNYVPIHFSTFRKIEIENDLLEDYSFLVRSENSPLTIRTKLSGEEFFKKRKINFSNLDLVMKDLSKLNNHVSLKGIDKSVKCKYLTIKMTMLPVNILGIINIDEMQDLQLTIFNETKRGNELVKIIRDNLHGDILDFKEALINAGFKDQAKL